MSTQATLKGIDQSGFACVALMARFLGLYADPDQLFHLFGRSDQSADTSELLRALKHLKLKARVTRVDWRGLKDLSLPAIAQHLDGRYFILAQIQGARVLIQEPSGRRPITLSSKEFAQEWNGTLILVTRRAWLPG